MERQPVVEAVRVNVVHGGEANRERGRTEMIGTPGNDGHLFPVRQITPLLHEFG